MVSTFQSVYSAAVVCTYNKARRDIKLPGKLAWVKFVSSFLPDSTGACGFHNKKPLGGSGNGTGFAA